MVVRHPDDHTPETPALDVVIYLIDPRDATSLYPESLALKRECVVHDPASPSRTFIPTYTGAREWATLRWYLATESATSPHFLTADIAEPILKDHRLLAADRPLTDQTIALIAHDAKKEDILRFTRHHLDLLLRFSKRLATGTTGTLLNGEEPKRLPRSKMKSSLRKEFDALVKAIKQHKLDQPWVYPQPSGPRGGDVQIAESILKGDCHKVIFFEDPHVSREHEADIQLLERTSRIPGQDVMCLHDYNSASEWAKSREACLEKSVLEPLTLSHAFQAVFGVELVLCDSVADQSDWSEEDIWHRLVQTAAWYLMNLISDLACKRAKTNSIVCASVTWGYSMHELVNGLRRIPPLLQDLDKELVEIRRGAACLSPKLADNGYWWPKNIRVLPMIGLMGSTDPRVEANENAAAMAACYGVEPAHLPRYAFLERNRVPPDFILDLDWEAVDVAVFTCDELKRNFGQKVIAPMPARLYEQMVKNGAVGEIGGMFLSANGRAVEPEDFARVGMQTKDLMNSARGGGAVMLVGAQSRRVAPALAALRGNLVSAIVTNRTFALDVLRGHYSL